MTNRSRSQPGDLTWFVLHLGLGLAWFLPLALLPRGVLTELLTRRRSGIWS
jgi:hypothetical protein